MRRLLADAGKPDRTPPAQQIYMAVSDSSTPARIDVRASGEILVSQPGAAALGWLSLDGITFFAE